MYTGAHISERIRRVKEEQNVTLEVYVFGPAERALGDPAREEFRDTLASLATSGVPVHVCRTIAKEMRSAFEFGRLGFTLEYRPRCVCADRNGGCDSHQFLRSFPDRIPELTRL